jgi:hypothetical protein
MTCDVNEVIGHSGRRSPSKSSNLQPPCADRKECWARIGRALDVRLAAPAPEWVCRRLPVRLVGYVERADLLGLVA